VKVRELPTRAWTRLTSREVLTFLGVGGTGYVVDVATFNLLLTVGPLADRDPVFARVLAVGVAMVVTYLGNRYWTWRGESTEDLARKVSLFIVFNIAGMGISVACLFVSHHLLGLTSRLADNISVNVVGLILGTVFRYSTYKRYVFAGPSGHEDGDPDAAQPATLSTDPEPTPHREQFADGSAH
jgi:putative flippase GtrA